jgi:hypothetical protein
MQQSKIGTMQRLQAFKYELRPNGEQKRNMISSVSGTGSRARSAIYRSCSAGSAGASSAQTCVFIAKGIKARGAGMG